MEILMKRFNELKASELTDIKVKRLYSFKGDLEMLYFDAPNNMQIRDLIKSVNFEIGQCENLLSKEFSVRRNFF